MQVYSESTRINLLILFLKRGQNFQLPDYSWRPWRYAARRLAQTRDTPDLMQLLLLQMFHDQDHHLKSSQLSSWFSPLSFWNVDVSLLSLCQTLQLSHQFLQQHSVHPIQEKMTDEIWHIFIRRFVAFTHTLNEHPPPPKKLYNISELFM